jgi:hypothetical protein
MRLTELKPGDWVVAPFPLVAGDDSHTSIFKVEKVLGEIVFTRRKRKLIEVELRRLVACTVRRGEVRAIYRP